MLRNDTLMSFAVLLEHLLIDSGSKSLEQLLTLKCTLKKNNTQLYLNIMLNIYILNVTY